MSDTLRVLKVIYDTVSHRDTIYIKGVESLEVLKKVDDMYNNAWNRLLIFGAMLSIIIPSVITWFLQFKLKASDKKFKKMTEELKVDNYRIKGFMAHMQAEVSKKWNENKPNNSQIILDYLKAIKNYIQGKDPKNITQCLSALDNWLNDIDGVERKQIGMQTDIRTDLALIDCDLPKIHRAAFEKVCLLLQ